MKRATYYTVYFETNMVTLDKQFITKKEAVKYAKEHLDDRPCIIKYENHGATMQVILNYADLSGTEDFYNDFGF